MNKICTSCNRERVYYAKDMCKSCYNKRGRTIIHEIVVTKEVVKPCEHCDGMGLEKLTWQQSDAVYKYIRQLLHPD